MKSDHKVGVLRIKRGQSSEEEIFANSNEPGSFDEFLNVLGETFVYAARKVSQEELTSGWDSESQWEVIDTTAQWVCWASLLTPVGGAVCLLTLNVLPIMDNCGVFVGPKQWDCWDDPVQPVVETVASCPRGKGSHSSSLLHTHTACGSLASQSQSSDPVGWRKLYMSWTTFHHHRQAGHRTTFHHHRQAGHVVHRPIIECQAVHASCGENLAPAGLMAYSLLRLTYSLQNLQKQVDL